MLFEFTVYLKNCQKLKLVGSFPTSFRCAKKISGAYNNLKIIEEMIPAPATTYFKFNLNLKH
jgi:hypothetical protein